jgi:CAAX prenyl protease-like protein
MTPLDPAPILNPQSAIRNSENLPRSSFVIRHSSFIESHPWLTFLLPFIVYMALGTFEPAAPKPPLQLPNGASRPAPNTNWFGLEYRHYPIVYTVKIAATIVAMLFVFPGYRQFPFRVSPLALAVGVIGVVLWIEICKPQLEHKFLVKVGFEDALGGERPAFDPLTELAATPVWACSFLAIRFLGLALIVPIIEEFFLRGFLMRFVVREDWWDVPFGTITPIAAIVGTAVPMLMHPGELLAALVWFSLVTWLMWRTKNIWDCVAAHAVTNLLLGIYVVTQHQWQLW